MAYDNTKDQTLREHELHGENGASLIIGAYSYNGCKAKIGMQRVLNTDSGRRWIKLSRLTMEEAEWVASQMADLVEEFSS